ncbi:aminotransferase class V-fold PLP-dependent enzyme [Collinsella tanakaei]|uniref:aminotransferase class V-fold PLP-dependent enzyme n=1 Tax=Collinsella tanakaei TaxID=626935 RepID=UPI00195CE9F7|nr:SufS family cysteine desulfurase [Collinsella tanakaei]MBM6867286.1 SufS family cysteine desulfurase [Collinsella tanakaei]
MIDIASNPYKADFPLLAAKPEIAFLDSGATAQRPACVLDAQRTFYETMNANPLRGLYSLSVEATEAIERVRAQIARLIGAVDDRGRALARDVVFTRNASESLNIVAKCFAPCVLEPGDEVAITIMEHHSNLIPWQQACRAAGATLVYLYPETDGTLTDEEIAAKIGPRTKIVSAAHVSNVLGVENPIRKLADAVHAQGGYLVTDAAQSVPHMAVDVRALGVDFLAFSGHKALGPMGIGVLWGRHELLEMMPPMLTGGEMIDSVTEQDAVWAPVPEKFEAGTQDAAGIFATGAALTYLTETVGYDAVREREEALIAYAMERLATLPYVQIIGPAEASRHHGVISFNVEGIHPHDVASILDMSGVCVRAGHHCAQPLLTWLRVENLACCRASLAFYNDASDIDRFIDALGSVWSTFHGDN